MIYECSFTLLSSFFSAPCSHGATLVVASKFEERNLAYKWLLLFDRLDHGYYAGLINGAEDVVVFTALFSCLDQGFLSTD